MIYKKELDTELPSLVASASGVVVELGPGSGNQLGRYDKKKAKKVVLTPSPLPSQPPHVLRRDLDHSNNAIKHNRSTASNQTPTFTQNFKTTSKLKV